MEKLILIKTLQELDSLLEVIRDADYISFDTETTGLDKDAEIIGFSVSPDVDTGYYVILKYWDVASSTLKALETCEGAKAIIEQLASKQLIMHNAVFDCQKVEDAYGVKLMPAVFCDTMILAHLLDENRRVGLKELGVSIFGEDANKEQKEMKESILKNGGQLTKKCYELYKADADLIGYYGAKDTVLTMKLFFHLIPQLYEQGLDKFFFEDESMPLLRGPTYELNTTGLRIDADKLQKLRQTLEVELLELKAFIYKEITPHVADKYPGTGKTNVFNIGASQQLAWLLFDKLDNEFNTLTKGGRELCQALDMKVPYAPGDKKKFIQNIMDLKGRVYAEAKYNWKTKKMGRPKKVGDYWQYLSCGKETISKLSKRYKWCEKLLEYSKSLKLLNTYVEGIQSRIRYNIIYPSFLQHGTTSGRYSSRNPNFQNLPRGDKRVKACVISRPGKLFVGADYSQLEPRVFASVSKDPTLLACFKKGEDFYSVIGAPIYDKTECSLFKDEANSFATLYEDLRNNSKIIALATPYGRTAFQQAATMGISRDEAQMLINRYFEQYPHVEAMMLESHEIVKKNGVVYNLFGRPRRIPEAKNITKIYGNASHSELPYTARTLLNLSMNHRVQSTAASIVNRAAIMLWDLIQARALEDSRYEEAKIVLQVHDEVIVECPQELAEEIRALLKHSMEKAVTLPGVDLIADPKIANNIAGLK